jgi:hypothetical protein
MNGNNKHKDFKMGLFTIGVVISLGAIVIASLQEAPSFVNATEGDYTMNFASNKNKCWTAVTTTESTATAKTALDNDVSFTYNNTGTALGYWGKINADGYFYNTTPIDGIKSIAITFKDTNGVKISYGWTANTYRVSDVSIAATEAGGTATYLFGNDQPSFFKIAYDTAIASIKSIALVYTCKASADPFIPGTEGLTVALGGDGTYYIVTGYSGSSTTVSINQTYRHLPIKEIAASAFSGCSAITSLVLPSSLTTIGDSAFSSCSSLTSLALPSTVTSIGGSAFSGCAGLTSLTIPQSVSSIGATAFTGTTFTTLNYSGTEREWASVTKETTWKDGSAITSVVCSDLSDDYTFTYTKTADGAGYILAKYNGTLTNVTIPSVFDGLPVKQIGNGSAVFSSYVTNITIPSSVNTVGASAFSGCSAITSLTLPTSITTIGASAFSGCSSLTSLTLPSTVTSIGGSAFSGCAGLTSLTIPQSVTSIGATAFTGTTFTTLNYSGTEKEWGAITKETTWKDGSSIVTTTCSDLSDDYQFTYAKNDDETGYTLTKYNGTSTDVTIPSAFEGLPVQFIEANGSYSSPFSSSLKNVVIPSSVISVGDYAFYNCASLSSPVLPSSLKSIGNSAFEGCSSITSVNIPDGVFRIEADAFSHCSSLENVSFPSSVQFIGDTPFLGCYKLSNFAIDSENRDFSYENFAVYDKNKTTLYFIVNSSIKSFSIPSTVTNIDSLSFDGCSSLTTVDIPASVTDIGNFAFYDCSSLISVSIPSSVTSIRESVFKNCSKLTSVEIPSTVTSIGWSAFESCSSLTSINIPSSVTSIGAFAFQSCTKLANLRIPSSVTSIEHGAFGSCSSLASISIPASVTTIESFLFDNCSGLTSVSIPSTITSIRNGAFHNCTQLTSVMIPSSVTSIESNAFFNCTALTSIAIPSSVTSIESNAFIGCLSLSIICQASSQPAGWDSAWNPYNRPVTWGSSYITSSTTTDGFGLSVAWDYAQTTSYSGTATSVDFPSTISGVTITTISSGFLSSNTTATYLRLPDTVTSIAAGAMQNCTALTTVIIGANVTSIGSTAFSGCTAIEACYYKGTPSQWSALNFTFFGDSVAYYSETDKSTETDHYYWHYDSDNKTPLLWNA